MTQSSGYDDIEPVLVETEDEEAYRCPELGIQFAENRTEEGKVVYLKSWFRESSIGTKNPFPARMDGRKNWTEEKRLSAAKALVPSNIEELSERVGHFMLW